MKKSTRTILQGLSDLVINKDVDHMIETRANNIIQSAINLLTLINEQYDAETSHDLERRFLNAIKNGDSSKFTRGIRRLQESKSKREK